MSSRDPLSKRFNDRRRFLGQLGGGVAGVTLGGCGGGSGDGSTAASATTPAAASASAPAIGAAPSPTAPSPTASPAPAASPAPVAPPPPAPSPAVATVSAQSITFQPINLFDLAMAGTWHTESRYGRQQFLDRWTGDTATVQLHSYNLGSGGSGTPFKSARYTLMVDDKPVASIDTPSIVSADTSSDVYKTNITFSTTGLAAGWHKLDLTGLSAGESTPTWWAYLIRGAVTEQTYMPVVRGTYELVMHPAPYNNIWAIVPGRYAPTPRPIVGKRTAIPFAEKITRSQMTCRQIVPFRFGDVHRPNVSKEGIVSTFDLQPYYFSDFVGKLPRVPLLDGARGVGTVCMVSHVELGTAVVNGVPRNGIYVCDPWRVAKVAEDGTVTTLVGYRHRNAMMVHWEDPADVELIGDWSAIPEERRGFHEIWGMCWDKRTLAIDPNAPPIEGENPHVVGPVMFVADSQNNRICKVQFNPADRKPPKVTEFITGLQDPWDVVFADGLLFISERGAHRVVSYDATSGAYVDTLVQGPALAYVDRNRTVNLLAPQAQVTAANCVSPEGLYLLDNFVYFGSKAQQLVRRIDRSTKAITTVCTVPIDGNSIFCKIAVSDGSFLPRGTTFVWHWSNTQYGFPATFLPDGSMWPWYEGNRSPGNWGGYVYATAGAVGQGRLVIGGANDGLMSIDKVQPGDSLPTDASERGAEDYVARGLHLLHGSSGFGFYGLPLPWGITDDIDAYLTHCGHVRA